MICVMFAVDALDAMARAGSARRSGCRASFGEDLDREAALERRVLRLVDAAHAADAEQTLDAEASAQDEADRVLGGQA